MSAVQGFRIVVATEASLGIGVNGGLPWKLPGDMAFFKQLTTSTSDPLKRNAVIMGRKTWESIPTKFRPLRDRINVVLSRQLDSKSQFGMPEDSFLCDSLTSALGLLSSMTDSVEKVFVIGGSSVYEEALAHELCDTVYVTRVKESFSCDTHFPPLDQSVYLLESSSKTMKEGDVEYDFATFTRVKSGKSVVPAALGAGAGRHEEYQYLDLIRDIIANGKVREDRTGTGTISKFGVQMRFDLRSTFPLLTTKNTFWRGIAEELLWFISGDTSAKTLQDRNIHIWDGNSSREYFDSIGLKDREVGDLGPVYGFQWRHFGAAYEGMRADYSGKGVDQLAGLIQRIKDKPTDRRLVLTAWNPADLPHMALPPCHMFCQFYVADGELSCQMYQRSADMGLGVPFNIGSYALLTRLVAHCTGLRAGELIHTIGDAHVYCNHVEALKEQLQREPKPFPTLAITTDNTDIDGFSLADLKLEGYKSHAKIKMEMAV